MSAFECFAFWMIAGAVCCFLLGIPKNDIPNPISANVFIALWPVWLFFALVSWMRKE